MIIMICYKISYFRIQITIGDIPELDDCSDNEEVNQNKPCKKRIKNSKKNGFMIKLTNLKLKPKLLLKRNAGV